jgi:hypothetical protein
VRRALIREVAQQFDQEPRIEGLECLVLEQMLAVVKQRLEARPLEMLGIVLVGGGEDGEEVGVQRRGLRVERSAKACAKWHEVKVCARWCEANGLLTCTL